MVDVDSSFTICLLDHHDIREPIQISCLTDEVDGQQFINLFIDGLLSLRSEASFLLSHRLIVGINIKSVDDDFWRDA